MTKHYNITISGKVQGVFFRASTKGKARSLGISGYAMNLADGNVYVEAEAGQAELDEFVQWCKRGPMGARVDKVDVKEAEVMRYETFEIRK